MQKSRNTVELSVVLPVYNEADSLDEMQKQLNTAIDKLNLSYEIIYVNDGSRDGSLQKLIDISSSHPEVIVLNLRRNFGQTAAIAAGLDHSCGKIIALMDADLQNDPEDIGSLIAKLNEGYDVVSGWRRERKDKFLTRRVPSAVANWLISVVTNVNLHDFGCTLKVYRREVIDEIRLYGQMHRFIPAFAEAAGARIAEMEVHHHPRRYGKTKYGLARIMRVVFDLITVKFLLSYRTTPMYLFGGVGFTLMGLGILALLASLVNKLVFGVSLILTPLPLLAATLFTLGIQSVLLGLTTELLVRTYHESQSKPIYILREIIQHDK